MKQPYAVLNKRSLGLRVALRPPLDWEADPQVRCCRTKGSISHGAELEGAACRSEGMGRLVESKLPEGREGRERVDPE